MGTARKSTGRLDWQPVGAFLGTKPTSTTKERFFFFFSLTGALEFWIIVYLRDNYSTKALAQNKNITRTKH